MVESLLLNISDYLQSSVACTYFLICGGFSIYRLGFILGSSFHDCFVQWFCARELILKVYHSSFENTPSSRLCLDIFLLSQSLSASCILSAAKKLARCCTISILLIQYSRPVSYTVEVYSMCGRHRLVYGNNLAVSKENG